MPMQSQPFVNSQVDNMSQSLLPQQSNPFISTTRKVTIEHDINGLLHTPPGASGTTVEACGKRETRDFVRPSAPVSSGKAGDRRSRSTTRSAKPKPRTRSVSSRSQKRSVSCSATRAPDDQRDQNSPPRNDEKMDEGSLTSQCTDG